MGVNTNMGVIYMGVNIKHVKDLGKNLKVFCYICISVYIIFVYYYSQYYITFC